MPIINQGWNTLPLGSGGLATGFDIAPDGTAVVRTDVGGCYVFSGKLPASIADPTKKWLPLMTFASMGAGAQFWGDIGGYELVIAPTATTNFYGIFLDNAGNQSTSYLYYTQNSGASWTKTSLAILNAGSASTQKNAGRKIAVDPNNADVVYVGMPKSSGAANSVYRTITGTTTNSFSAVSGISQTTQDPGVCGICFDASAGTVVVSGQTRTKRIIIPVGGVGIYESNDGGVTFTEVAATAMGSAAVSVWQAQIDASGVYYASVNNSTVGQLWRYSGAAGTWARLDNQTNFTSAAGAGYMQATGMVILVDPRSGHQGWLTVMGPQGLGAGFTSHNANTATASAATWAGQSGGYTDHNFAASYDVPWLSHGLAGTNGFLGGTAAIIDQGGYCWWCGNQGTLWYYTTSDNVTPILPDFSISPPVDTYSTSISRGTEITVAEDVICPPGATYPVMAAQDVGMQGGTFVGYGTDYYPDGSFTAAQTGGVVRRVDGFSLAYAPGNPSFVAGKMTCTSFAGSGQKFSGYSTNYGQVGSWTPYAAQPEAFYGDGVVTAGGFVCVIDEDHHVVVPGGNISYQPIFTATARTTATWANCTGLPSVNWTRTLYFFGSQPRPRPFAAGQGANIGHAYALDAGTTGTATLYRSTDSGANWSSFGTISNFGASGSNFVCPILYSVPGFPNDLWASAQFVSSTNSGFWHSTNEGASWSAVTLPSAKFVQYFCLGKPISPSTNPTIYLAVWDGTGVFQDTALYYSTNLGVTWNTLGATGTSADLPTSLQLYGVKSLCGDWSHEGVVYATSIGTGFAYYALNGSALVTAFRMRLHG